MAWMGGTGWKTGQKRPERFFPARRLCSAAPLGLCCRGKVLAHLIGHHDARQNRQAHLTLDPVSNWTGYLKHTSHQARSINPAQAEGSRMPALCVETENKASRPTFASVRPCLPGGIRHIFGSPVRGLSLSPLPSQARCHGREWTIPKAPPRWR